MTRVTMLLAAALFVFLGWPPAAQADGHRPLVEAWWVQERLGDPNLVVLDVRNAIDGGGRDAYEAGHIPGAVYSDYINDGWRQPVNDVVGMLPSVEALEDLIGGLGIGNDDHVVVVHAGQSSTDFGSATRIYWTFRTLGHDRVSILDGGMAAWTRESFPLEPGVITRPAEVFTAQYTEQFLVTPAEVRQVVADQSQVLLDGRPSAQFRGEAKHGQARVAGTLPGAVNVPHARVVVADGSNTVPPEALQALLAEHGVPEDAPVITFCNTGHWASILWFALSEIAGREDVRMFDSSMVGWTRDPNNPVVTVEVGDIRAPVAAQ